VKIKIIAVGKLKKGYIMEGVKDYKERISHYANIEIFEIVEKSVEKFISPKTFNIFLERTGTEISSMEFSDFIKEQLTYSSKDIAFFIGGAEGFDKSIIKKADLKLSFSKMTFPHEVSRLILLEQIYRAFTIINNEKYHK
jgi:23S rRNA (pseudouridine1915-N3)-methyltransferase